MPRLLIVFAALPALCALSLVAQQPVELTQAPAATIAGFLKSGNNSPTDRNAAKLFAKASKDFDTHKFPAALDGLRKADQADGGRCISCETLAYAAAMHLDDFQSAHAETTLLLQNVTSPEDKAEIHAIIGDVCLAEGGYRIFQQPFQQADTEFQAALQLQPNRADCLYKDGLALAHLNQFPKAQERFEQVAKLFPASDSQFPHARLFSAHPELARKRIAPAFQFQTLDGKTISTENMAGKVVLIDFWATWCGPCKNALPHLKEIATKFQGQPLVVVSISVDQDENTWKYFITHNGMVWNQYRDGGFDGPIASRFNVKAIPTTITIDGDGFVQDRQVGDGDLEKKLKELIAKVQPETAQKTAIADQTK